MGIDEKVIAMFARVRKVSLTANGWAGPCQDDFLGVTVHWIDENWIQREMVIGFEPLNGSHTAKNLVEAVEALINALERFYLGEKVQSITNDNAQNMAKMVRDLVTHQRATQWYFHSLF